MRVLLILVGLIAAQAVGAQATASRINEQKQDAAKVAENNIKQNAESPDRDSLGNSESPENLLNLRPTEKPPVSRKIPYAITTEGRPPSSAAILAAAIARMERAEKEAERVKKAEKQEAERAERAEKEKIERQKQELKRAEKAAKKSDRWGEFKPDGAGNASSSDEEEELLRKKQKLLMGPKKP